MTKRKRSVALILSALLLPGLAACSGEEAAEGGDATTEEGTDDAADDAADG